MRSKKSINIGYWNVNKLISKHCNKLKDEQFSKSITKCDIIALSETKSDLSGIDIDNFVVTNVSRVKTSKQNQEYGGLAILIDKSVRKGVKYLKNTCSEYQWIVLDKDYFGFNNQVYVCFAYIPPVGSSYFKNSDIDILAQLNSEIALYQGKGETVIFGDFNARTGCLKDFVSVNDDDVDEYLPVHDEYESDIVKVIRTSQDSKCCSRGKDLLDLCVASRMRILNGRTLGDFQGRFTSYQYNGNSVIDYCLVSEDFMRNVLYFYVDDPLLRLSDHSKVSVRLVASVKVEDMGTENLDDFPCNFKWNSVSPELFVNALQNTEIQTKVRKLIDTQCQTLLDMDEALESMQEVLISAAKKSLKRKSVIKRKGRKSKPWFDNSLVGMRRD